MRTGRRMIKDGRWPRVAESEDACRGMWHWGLIREGCGCPTMGLARCSGGRPGPSGLFARRCVCESEVFRQLTHVRAAQTALGAERWARVRARRGREGGRSHHSQREPARWLLAGAARRPVVTGRGRDTWRAGGHRSPGAAPDHRPGSEGMWDRRRGTSGGHSCDGSFKGAEGVLRECGRPHVYLVKR